MRTSKLENTQIQALKHATAILKKAKRDYPSAIARIQRAEQFLREHIEGLGYESGRWGHLYGTETFTYPRRAAVYNGGFGEVTAKLYTLFFASDDTGWHFRIAPTIEQERGTLIQDEKAIRLLDASAGMVLCCAADIETDSVKILEYLAAIVEASYDREHGTPAAPHRTANGATPARSGSKALIH